MFRDTIIPGAYGIFSENEKDERLSTCKFILVRKLCFYVV